MKNYKVSQTFYLTGYATLPDKNNPEKITDYAWLVNSLRNLILNGGNLEKGDEISIKHKENNYTRYSDIRIDKVKYTTDENGIVNGIDLEVYIKYL